MGRGTHGMADLSGWPDGMRLIVRKERPHPVAQLRFTDVDGLRITAFVTNTKHGQLAELELRHRQRARCEDRIRNSKDTGLTLSLHPRPAGRRTSGFILIARKKSRPVGQGRVARGNLTPRPPHPGTTPPPPRPK